MRTLILALVAMTTALTLIACEDVPKTLEVEGPTSLSVGDDGTFTATAIGGYPIVGQVRFWWYFDDDGDDWPDKGESLYVSKTINPDADRKSVSRIGWIPAKEMIGKRVLSVYVTFLDPGSEGYVSRNAEHAVTITK